MIFGIFGRFLDKFSQMLAKFENTTKQKFSYKQIQEFLYKRYLIFDENVKFSCYASCKNNAESVLLSHK